MSKISLNGVNTKKFASLLKRSASMDNLIFITLNGSKFESAAYNKNKSALKSVYADLEQMCDEFSNMCDESVKIQFSNANKLLQCISLVGTENVDVTFDIEDNNYAKKVTIKNDFVNLTVACADVEAVSFLEIPDNVRHSIFEDNSKLLYSMNMTDDEFKYIKSLHGLNKDAVRVFFQLSGDNVYMSEIESTDENVRYEVNEIIQNDNYEAFTNFEKLYTKKLNISDFSNVAGVENHLACFNKAWFDWIDNDKSYTVELHSKMIKFLSYDEEQSVKTYVIITPTRFA